MPGLGVVELLDVEDALCPDDKAGLFPDLTFSSSQHSLCALHSATRCNPEAVRAFFAMPHEEQTAVVLVEGAGRDAMVHLCGLMLEAR